jgi:hypothetical protein
MVHYPTTALPTQTVWADPRVGPPRRMHRYLGLAGQNTQFYILNSKLKKPAASAAAIAVACGFNLRRSCQKQTTLHFTLTPHPWLVLGFEGNLAEDGAGHRL